VRAVDEGALVLRAGDLVGRYRVDAEIGSGGQGIVARASDLELGRSLAIKVIRHAEPRSRERILREARALAALEHPNVARVLDVGEHRGRVFIAMEYIDGANLGQWWADDRVDRKQRVGALCDAGRGLAAAHAAGLVHRDFKPANVLVARNGRVVVTDFGLVLDQESDAPRLTDRNLRIGTPGYMAPEQVLGNEVGTRADQFAFCVSLFEAAYRVRPFEGRNVAELVGAMARRIATAPKGQSAPRWLRRVIERGLDPDPAQRFASMTALLDAIEAGPRRVRRLVLGVVAIAIVVLAVLAVPKAATPIAVPTTFERMPQPLAVLGGPNSQWTRDRAIGVLADVDADREAGRNAEARDGAERIRVAALAEGDESVARWALANRGWAEAALPDAVAARRTFTQLREEAQRSGDDLQLAHAALGLFELDRFDGNLDRALEWTDEAEAAALRVEMPLRIWVHVQVSRAVIAFTRGDLDAAEAGWMDALDLCADDAEGDRARALLLNNLGAIQGRRQNFVQAAALLAESAQLYAEILPEDHLDLATVETNLGLNLVKAGEVAGGIDLMYAALARTQRSRVAPDEGLADTHLTVADALYNAEDPRACLVHAKAAMEMLDELEAPASIEVGAPYRVSVCALALGDVATAETAGAKAMALLETVEAEPEVATLVRFGYAKAAAAGGRVEVARRGAASAIEGAGQEKRHEIEAWVKGL
jgi:predicted Ser/Thr protein kinase/tetratricopeptide (TPR) repeat protein